jgi:lipopolysaccharide/colanic/teichoic acid biosynthesis glycosyltransferase
MRVGADEVRTRDGSVVVHPGDGRLTRIGQTLRARGIDELPQLINVLLGDMSLVGPRPDLLDQLGLYRQTDYERLYMRPGLTGLTVIRGRGLSWRNKKRWDRRYVQKWSLRLDLFILWSTARVVFGRHSPSRTARVPPAS